jgi:hypothetical protein
MRAVSRFRARALLAVWATAAALTAGAVPSAPGTPTAPAGCRLHVTRWFPGPHGGTDDPERRGCRDRAEEGDETSA